MNVFESTSVSWWSGETVVTCNGTELARLKFGDWKKLGSISLDENEYEVVRTSIFSAELVFRSKDALLFRTWIEGIWNQSADLDFDGVKYKLKWSGWKSRAILEKEGQEIGAVESGGWFSNGQRAAFSEGLPPLIAVFVIWLVAYKRRGDSAAAVAG